MISKILLGRLAVAPAALAMTVFLATSSVALPSGLELVSSADGTHPCETGCADLSISDDGRFVAFRSGTSDLGSENEQGVVGIYLRDRARNKTFAISRYPGSPSRLADGANPRVSGDGRFVLFASSGRLVPQDQNDVTDVYLYSTEKDTLELVSSRPDGKAGNNHSDCGDMSPDGRFVLFSSQANDLTGDSDKDDGAVDLFLRDRKTGKTELLSQAAGANDVGGAFDRISADGRFVSFVVPSAVAPIFDPTLESAPEKGQSSVLLDREERTYKVISRRVDSPEIAADGSQNMVVWMSRDAGSLLFVSDSDDLLDSPRAQSADNSTQILRYTVANGLIELMNTDEQKKLQSGLYLLSKLDEAGRYLLFSDMNEGNLLLKDMNSGQVVPVVAEAGRTDYFDMTADGRFIVFQRQWSDDERAQAYLLENPLWKSN